MNLRAVLAALSLDVLVAFAVDTSAAATALTNSLHIMMSMSSLTADSAIDVFTWTADRFLPVCFASDSWDVFWKADRSCRMSMEDLS